jgi:large subunit ribosomal protein L6
MSRIGKQPIQVPSGVTVSQGQDREVTVKGPKGSLSISLRPEIDIEVAGTRVLVKRNEKGSERAGRAYHGMTRALLANMVDGVTKGFQKKLEIQGVGWNAQVQPKKVVLNIGYCHPVDVAIPDGIKVECPNPTSILVSGPDKKDVGQMAANLRAIRPPEPYKGKGIRYDGEYVRRKAGKSFGS